MSFDLGFREKSQQDDTRNRSWIVGSPVSESTMAPHVFSILFPDIGLPKHKYGYLDCKSVDEPGNIWHQEVHKPYSMGSCLTMPLKVEAMKYCDKLTDISKAVGSVNTTFFEKDENGKEIMVGTNTDVNGCGNALLANITGEATPFREDMARKFAPRSAAALSVGGGGAARAVVYALNSLGFSPIYLCNRDKVEIENLVSQFPELDLVPLESLEQVDQILGDKSKSPIVAGVGAIPSIEPKTSEEKLVYDICQKIFASKYDPGPSNQEGYLSFPSKRVFLDMAYKPQWTILRNMAEKENWLSVCGIEAVFECVFAQCYIWTGIEPNKEQRDKARKHCRSLIFK